MFESFEIQDVVRPDVTLRVRTAGLESPHTLPLLLPHGHPQSHTMWHRVAPALDSVHCIAEEAPDALLARIHPFFKDNDS